MGSIVSFCEPQTNRLSVGQDDRIAVNAPQQTAASSENSASKQQLSNGSSSHRFDMGRRYVNQPDVAYMLPNDDEENDRIHQQHWFFKIILGGNYHVPIEQDLIKGITVLDAGCGPATWSLEMSREYPKTQFYGCDISAVFPQTVKPQNCHFDVANILTGLPYPDNHFDFVHQRLLTAGFRADDWVKDISELLRVLKPGGWLELIEWSIDVENNHGKRMQELFKVMGKTAQLRGISLTLAPKLGEYLERGGATNIQQQVFKPALKEPDHIGEARWATFCEGYRGLRPLLIKAHPEFENDDNFEEFLRASGEEAQEHNTRLPIYVFTCQKPAIEKQ